MRLSIGERTEVYGLTFDIMGLVLLGCFAFWILDFWIFGLDVTKLRYFDNLSPGVPSWEIGSAGLRVLMEFCYSPGLLSRFPVFEVLEFFT